MSAKNLIFTICVLYLSIDYAHPANVKTVPNWDLLIFTQNWPATVCKEWKEKNKSHTCSFPKKQDSWTIHGIWPTKLGTIGPAFCNRTWHFDPDQIKPIETSLLQLWTNVETETSTYALWAHEWNKHGTCAAILEPLNSEIKYFNKGLEWMNKFMMYDILKNANILPSDDKEYPIIDIHNAVKNKLGTNPVIECKKEDGKNFIVELRICFNKDLELTDCDGVVGDWKMMINDMTVLTNCNKSVGVLYPHDVMYTPPNKLYVQLYKLVLWLQWFTL